jgi:hypothetical protein
MKSENQNYWDKILVKASGLALITVALTWLPQVLAAMTKLAAITFQSGMVVRQEGKVGELIDTYQIQMVSNAIGDVLAFVVLVAIARWVLSFPKVLQKWMGHQPLELPRSEGE